MVVSAYGKGVVADYLFKTPLCAAMGTDPVNTGAYTALWELLLETLSDKYYF